MRPPLVKRAVLMMAESINGLYKTELTKRQSWKTQTELELATLKWVHWYNEKRILSSIGNMPPARAEELYYDHLSQEAKMVA